MKKLLCLLAAVIMILSLAACAGEGNVPDDKDSDSSKTASAEKKIDVDLTSMSSTMIYSKVQNMQQKPDSFIGKIVKMKGAFSVAEMNGKRYYACIIKDATACCAQGIEFEWAGDHNYPADYPKENSEITVVGTFSTYIEGKNKYLLLEDADLQF